MAVRDTSTGQGNTSGSVQPSCNWPTVAAGDTAIISCCVDAGADTLSPPAGFTAFEATAHPAADGQSVRFAYKLNCTGSESGALTWSGATTSNRDYVCQAVTLSGRDTATIAASAVKVQSTAQSSPASIDANGVTASAGDDLVFMAGGDPTDGSVTWAGTAPSGYTEKQDTARAWSWGYLATKENVSAGATGTVTATETLAGKSTGYASILIRVPAAGGGGAAAYIPRAGVISQAVKRAAYI